MNNSKNKLNSIKNKLNSKKKKNFAFFSQCQTNLTSLIIISLTIYIYIYGLAINMLGISQQCNK